MLKINASDVDLFLIDHVKFMSCGVDRLRPLVKKFGQAQFSIQVALYDLYPRGNGDKWAFDSSKKLKDLIEETGHKGYIEVS